MVRSVYCLSFKRNIILWGDFVWWPVSPAGHARSCADTLLRPCVYADMRWWAHADMRWWAGGLGEVSLVVSIPMPAFRAVQPTLFHCCLVSNKIAAMRRAVSVKCRTSSGRRLRPRTLCSR